MGNTRKATSRTSKGRTKTSRASKARTKKSRTSKARTTSSHSRASAPKKKKVVLLSGGNPQIAMADGDAPVQAYIRAMPGWKRDVGEWIDALVTKNVRGVCKAVKWNSPFYGVEGNGWFLSFHCFARYVKVTFFRGSALEPPPPGPSKQKHTRYLDIHEDDERDDTQLAKWIKQAAALPGWVPGQPF